MKKSLFAFFVFFSLFCFSQKDSINSFFTNASSFNKKRFAAVMGTEGVVCTATLIGLNELWYKDFPRSGFHAFNDNAEWLGMDKCGHAVTSYYIGRLGIGLMKWSGVERKRAIWYGGLLGTVYQSTIEVLDGFSSQWGFSWGDFGANTLGSALVIGEQLAWDEQRIVLKFSFHQTSYPQYRPNVLGETLQEEIIKDYNGQTYWLSGNISSFLPEESKFPKWLNVAVGYGAQGMTGGFDNPIYYAPGGNKITFERSRQFYFALDADLTRIKTKSKFLKAFFGTFGFIKIPAPALEFGTRGVKFHALYF